jgi:hypothetical protein
MASVSGNVDSNVSGRAWWPPSLCLNAGDHEGRPDARDSVGARRGAVFNVGDHEGRPDARDSVGARPGALGRGLSHTHQGKE